LTLKERKSKRGRRRELNQGKKPFNMVKKNSSNCDTDKTYPNFGYSTTTNVWLNPNMSDAFFGYKTVF
jgi:hypothetical protein